MKNTLITLSLFLLAQATFAKSLATPFVIDTVLVDENVTYAFSQDEDYLFLDISTSDEKTIMSMLLLGVSVFFDIKGKKKQNVFVKYPAEAIQANNKGERGGERRGPRTRDEEEIVSPEEELNRHKKRITEILENNYPQEATYSYFDSEEAFNTLLNTVDISVSFSYDEINGLLKYSLQIPKDKVNNDLKKDFSKLTVGVKTIKPERNKPDGGGLNGSIGGINVGGQQNGQGRSGGGQRGGRQGGGGPPGGGSGGQGGQRGGRPSGEEDRPTDTLLNFWFKPDIETSR